jgi:hypothetical protein
MSSFSEFAKKKVLGVPVIYLVGAFVAILALVAWKLKPTVDPTTGDTASDPAAGGGTDTPTDSTTGMPDYSSLDNTGTVVVTPTPLPTADVTAETNDTWLKAAIAAVVAAKAATTADAQSALTKYLSGDNLSFDEGKIRDVALLKEGIPPEPLTQIGSVSAAPAQKQFTNFPGTHTVKGASDNSMSKIATLYYGSGDGVHADKIAAANTSLGPTASVLNVGTRVHVPAWVTPKFVKAAKGYQTDSQIASKNGIAAINVQRLNPNRTSPYPIGTAIRVA